MMVDLQVTGGPAQQLGQHHLARLEWRIAQIAAIELQQVESEQHRLPLHLAAVEQPLAGTPSAPQITTSPSTRQDRQEAILCFQVRNRPGR
jgi:hypothetical protein